MNREISVEAYSYLYDIETNLRKIIEKGMKNLYGNYWHDKITISIEKFHYPDLIRFIRDYPSAFPSIDETTLNRLNNFRDTRNKVCHMRELSSGEINEAKALSKLILRLVRNSGKMPKRVVNFHLLQRL